MEKSVEGDDVAFLKELPQNVLFKIDIVKCFADVCIVAFGKENIGNARNRDLKTQIVIGFPLKCRFCQ